jgi:hypothetical protein
VKEWTGHSQDYEPLAGVGCMSRSTINGAHHLEERNQKEMLSSFACILYLCHLLNNVNRPQLHNTQKIMLVSKESN